MTDVRTIADLAVRHVMAEHHLEPQKYPPSVQCFWPQSRYSAVRKRKGRPVQEILHWWTFLKDKPGHITLNLYFDLRWNRWGLAIERWWRLADARRRSRYVFLGTARSLDTLLTRCLPKAWADHQAFIEPLQARAVEQELSGRSRGRNVYDYLREHGINDPVHFLSWSPP